MHKPAHTQTMLANGIPCARVSTKKNPSKFLSHLYGSEVWRNENPQPINSPSRTRDSSTTCTTSAWEVWRWGPRGWRSGRAGRLATPLQLQPEPWSVGIVGIMNWILDMHDYNIMACEHRVMKVWKLASHGCMVAWLHGCRWYEVATSPALLAGGC